MAYRRRQGMTRASTFKEESLFHAPRDVQGENDGRGILTTSRTFSPSSSSLAVQAIKASATYSSDSIPNSFRSSRVFGAYDGSLRTDGGTGFWGVLARRAKAILDENGDTEQREAVVSSASQTHEFNFQSSAHGQKMIENPTLRKGLDKITLSLNQLGNTFEKAFEEGRSIVENKTADIIQETRKLQVRGNIGSSNHEISPTDANSWQPLVHPQNHETRIKASRDVAMATAAKAKLLLRELKTVKAELAFLKQRCSQLEDENKILRDSREKGGNPADDDLIRLQLETLLAEKARLAHENSICARENRFLREIVEYHQLTMQDVVYLDEGTEEVTNMLAGSPLSPTSPTDDDAPVISSQSNETQDTIEFPSRDGQVQGYTNVSTIPVAGTENDNEVNTE